MSILSAWRARRTARVEHDRFLDWCEREAARAFHATACGSMCPCGASEPDEPALDLAAELRGIRVGDDTVTA